MNIFLGAFIFGLLGSFHCAGMCGAIALSIPMDLRTRLNLLRDSLVYNFGRVITYSLLGLIPGTLGRAFFASGYQQWLSVEIGVLILLFYFAPARFTDKISRVTGFSYLTDTVKKSFGKLLNRPDKGTLLLIGMLNGLLPCGFVYMALASATLTGERTGGMVYMFLFGIGTMPIMMLVSFSRKFLSLNLRNRVRNLMPYMAMTIAVLFILRGLALGIPVISPKVPSATAQYEDKFCITPMK